MPLLQTLAAIGRFIRRTPPPPAELLEAYAHEVIPVLDRAEWLYDYWLEQSTLFTDGEKLGNVAAIHRWETATMGRSLDRVIPPAALADAHGRVVEALELASRAAQLLSNGSRYHNANAVCEGQALLTASRERRLAALRAMRRYLARHAPAVTTEGQLVPPPAPPETAPPETAPTAPPSVEAAPAAEADPAATDRLVHAPAGHVPLLSEPPDSAVPVSAATPPPDPVAAADARLPGPDGGELGQADPATPSPEWTDPAEPAPGWLDAVQAERVAERVAATAAPPAAGAAPAEPPTSEAPPTEPASATPHAASAEPSSAQQGQPEDAAGLPGGAPRPAGPPGAPVPSTGQAAAASPRADALPADGQPPRADGAASSADDRGRWGSLFDEPPDPPAR